MNHSKHILLFHARKFLSRYCLIGIFQLVLCFGSFAQQKKITGIITGIGNLPLFGANVTVKSSNKSTITDSSGSFSITANNGDVLFISFIGYKSKELKITNQYELTIFLSQSVIDIDEIFLTGYTS